MLDSLEIRGFRCFERFEVNGLARVNLLVGTNNCGKSSLLEAVKLWAGRGAPDALEAVFQRRGERTQATAPSRYDPELAVRHLFHGHALDTDRSFEIATTSNGTRHSIQAAIETAPVPDVSEFDVEPGPQLLLLAEDEVSSDVVREGPLAFRMTTNVAALPSYTLRLTPEGGLPVRLLRQIPRIRSVGSNVFIPTRSLTTTEVGAMFGEIVLTDEEPLIISALQSIEPSIERVALAIGEGRASSTSGLFVRCHGQPQRIPIGSMGDGIWRLLTMALALVKTRGGILLIDEIDTGLHFSVMFEMWRLVIETAKRLDVQVFATTHSRDCYESLAAVLRDGQAGPGTAAIHRIERERGRTVVFDEQQIIIAAERGIEVR